VLLRRHRPGRFACLHRLDRLGVGPALLLAVVGVLPLLVAYFDGPALGRFVDLAVYRDAGASLLLDRPVYEHESARTGLPFTYPPIAALLAIPLTLVPRPALDAAWAVSALLLLAWLTRRLFPTMTPGVLALVFVGLLWLLPVRETLRFGQVNLLLLALVVADLTSARPRWPRGVLIGVAAAVKLTPLVFVPWLWLSGRRREAVWAGVAAGGLTVLAAVLLPGTSEAFWTDALLRPDRLGANDGISNQSLRGALLRSGLVEPWSTVLWLSAAAVVGVLGLVRASRADLLSGLTLTGLLAVLLSPVAWQHHLVWVVPALAVLVRAGRPRAAVATAIFFTLTTPSFGHVQSREGWPGQPLWWLLEQSYCLGALALLLLLPLRSPGTVEARSAVEASRRPFAA
jgi:alpha-1,2-mannosyltransferase